MYKYSFGHIQKRLNFPVLLFMNSLNGSSSSITTTESYTMLHIYIATRPPCLWGSCTAHTV